MTILQNSHLMSLNNVLFFCYFQTTEKKKKKKKKVKEEEDEWTNRFYIFFSLVFFVISTCKSPLQNWLFSDVSRMLCHMSFIIFISVIMITMCFWFMQWVNSSFIN